MDFEEALERFAKVKRPDFEKDKSTKNSVPDEKKGIQRAYQKNGDYIMKLATLYVMTRVGGVPYGG